MRLCVVQSDDVWGKQYKNSNTANTEATVQQNNTTQI